MSLWTIFTESIDALNGIGSYLTTQLVVDIANQLMAFITALLYPIYGIEYLFQNIWNVVYLYYATFYNLFVTIANTPLILFGAVFVLPSAWTTLLYISITISLTIRMYKWVKEIRGWIPTYSGDSK